MFGEQEILKQSNILFGKKSIRIFQRGLDYFFFSNSIQEFILDTDIISTISSDHSPLLISFYKEKQNNKSSGFLKFNNSLQSGNISKETLKHSKYKK